MHQLLDLKKNYNSMIWPSSSSLFRRFGCTEPPEVLFSSQLLLVLHTLLLSSKGEEKLNDELAPSIELRKK